MASSIESSFLGLLTFQLLSQFCFSRVRCIVSRAFILVPAGFMAEMLATHRTMSAKTFAAANRNTMKVSYIPSQMDGLAATTSSSTRESPLRLVLRDVSVLFGSLFYLPAMFMPIATNIQNAEMYATWPNLRDSMIHVVLFLLEVLMLMMVVPAFTILPGAVFMSVALACCGVVYVVSTPIRGPRVVKSSPEPTSLPNMGQFGDERWLFVNGIASSNHWLQTNVDQLSSTFGRPILGIHNRSYGLIYDLLESLVQRCFSITTEDSRIMYDHLKAFVLDPSVKKVVVIAHSQGGLVLSMVLDRMYTDLPCDQMSKLEIYTFGSAASHFNNPLKTIRSRGASHRGLSGGTNRTEESERKIPHIEHYCNENDLVGRWGVLYNIMCVPDNRYCGLIFTRCNATGHLFNQHYMDAMFPSDPLLANAFLDEPVELDEKTAIQREGAYVQTMAFMKLTSTDGIEDASSAVTQNGLRINFVDAVKANAEGVRGRTVRQLSRLWRYRNGQKPSIPLETMDGLINDVVTLKGGK